MSIEDSLKNSFFLSNFHIIGVLLLIYFLWLQIRKQWTYTIIKALWSFPGPKGVPILGNILSLSGTAVERFRIYRKLAKTYPDLYRLWFMNMAAVFIFNPDDVEKVLTDTKFHEKNFTYSFFVPWLRDGLFTSSGEKKYKQRRKLLAPAFNYNMLKEFVNIFEKHNSQLADFFASEAEKSETNLVEFLPQATAQLICETLMGYQVQSNKANSYVKAIHSFTNITLSRIYRPWLHSNFLFNLTKIGKQSNELLKDLHTFSSTMIENRLATWNENNLPTVTSASGKRNYAMIDWLIKQMNDGADINVKEIQEEADTILFGGHDTTSMVSAYALLLLGNHPEVQDKVYSELRLIFEDTNRKATYEDLQAMTYLDMCVKETLRLFPNPIISRVATENITFKNYQVPKGVSIYISIYDLHRNPRYWPNPERFDPERFTVDNCRERHPFAYLPFSTGLRYCPGNKYALLELKSFVSNIIRNYELKPVDTMESIILYSDVVLRSQNGVKVKFLKRMK